MLWIPLHQTWQIYWRSLEYCYTKLATYSTIHIYTKGRWTPGQSITDALHTTTPTAQSQTIHIYRCRWTPHHSSTDALHTTTPTARSWTMHIYRGRWTPHHSSTDALHTTTPTARSWTMHIYRGSWTPPSFQHRCIEYCYTKYISTTQWNPA